MSFPALPQRREFLQIGASSFVGLGLPSLLAAREAASASQAQSPRSVILVVLAGGLSHIDTVDMKPDAPAEIRGEFKPIPTAVPGIQICEHLPKLAERLKHWVIVRSMSHEEYNHLPGTHRLLTGAKMPLQRNTDLDNILSRRDWPCYAAGLNFVRPRHDGVPNGVTLPHALIEGPLIWPGQHAGFLGPSHDPLIVTQDPNSPNFRMDILALHEGLEPERVAARQRLLDQINRANESDPFRKYRQTAFEMLISGKVAEAFRIDREPDRVRERYGRNQFGQSLLLSRRLVQAGVPIIQANMGIVQTWDTHVDNWGRLKGYLLPWLDQGLAALIDDLQAEGRLEQTLVIVGTEFGRTPRISTLPGQTIPGRDHWAAVYSVMFAGGGVRGGRVIGQSDRAGAYPTTTTYTPFDLGATVYEFLGVPADTEIRDSLNRPLQLNSGRPMRFLFSA